MGVMGVLVLEFCVHSDCEFMDQSPFEVAEVLSALKFRTRNSYQKYECVHRVSGERLYYE